MNRNIQKAILAIVAAATLTISQTVSAATQYRAVDLGRLGGTYNQATTSTMPCRLWAPPPASHAVRGFTWYKGRLTDLGSELASGKGLTFAEGINGRGQIVGYNGPAHHAYLWYKGISTDLRAPGGGTSGALAINNQGRVAGWGTTDAGDTHAVLWSK